MRSFVELELATGVPGYVWNQLRKEGLISTRQPGYRRRHSISSAMFNSYVNRCAYLQHKLGRVPGPQHIRGIL